MLSGKCRCSVIIENVDGAVVAFFSGPLCEPTAKVVFLLRVLCGVVVRVSGLLL